MLPLSDMKEKYFASMLLKLTTHTCPTNIKLLTFSSGSLFFLCMTNIDSFKRKQWDI